MRLFSPLPVLLLIPAVWVRAESDLVQVSRALTASPRVETVLPLLPKINSCLHDEATATECLPLAEQAAEILLPTAAQKGHWPAAASLLKGAARLRFEQAEPEKAAKHLESLRKLYRFPPELLPPENPERQRARWTNEVALEYLRGEQLKSALEVLGESTDRAAQFPTRFDETQAAVAGALFRRLEQLSTSERYDLLYAWTLPAGGVRTVRDFVSLASFEAPPDAFARALGERPRANAFPIPQVGGVDGLFSTSWLLVRAAAESGRLRR